MTRPLRIAYPGAFYHVTCRGNARQDIVRDDRDRHAFLNRLGIALETHQVLLHCYVLMTNHFHLVVETPQANLSAFMRQFNVLYSGYFNRRHHWVGHLYQGRFKAILVEAEVYLSRAVAVCAPEPRARGDVAAGSCHRAAAEAQAVSVEQSGRLCQQAAAFAAGHVCIGVSPLWRGYAAGTPGLCAVHRRRDREPAPKPMGGAAWTDRAGDGGVCGAGPFPSGYRARSGPGATGATFLADQFPRIVSYQPWVSCGISTQPWRWWRRSLDCEVSELCQRGGRARASVGHRVSVSGDRGKSAGARAALWRRGLQLGQSATEDGA